MATIYSNRNDGVGYEVNANPNATSTWAGGVVPNAADQVYVVGRRTTWNSGNVYKWTGTRTCTVASTTGFATNGYFYTVTTDGQILKINYTGITSTTFTNCIVDDTFDLLYDNGWETTRNNGYIANGYYVLNPSLILEIKAGQNFTCNEMIIQEGGYVLVHQGGTLTVNQGLLVRDGWLLGRGEGNIVIQRPAGSLTTIGYFTGENYYMSVIDIEGGENRVYATTTQNVNIGDVSIDIDTPQNGEFVWGDDVALYNHRERRFRNKEYVGYRDATANFGEDSDEGLDVVGVDGNSVFVALRNGARGDIKASSNANGQAILDVYMDNVYFNKGDIVVINNKKYIINKVEDSEFEIKNYDFTNPSQDLSDFWVNDTTNHLYSGGWSIDAYGLTNSGGYSELVNKYIWERDVIVEAELSPLNNWDTGTRGTQDFGLLTSYDPAYRKGHRGYDGFKTDYFRIDDAADAIDFMQRWVTTYQNNRLSRDTNLRTITRGPATYRVDCRKAMSTVYINGKQFSKEYYRNGNPKGLVGIYNDGNVSMHCRRLTISLPCQRVYITTTDAIAPNQRIWRSGIERVKTAGARLVKIASINTGEGNHTDLNFAYRGQYGNGQWPMLMGYNSNSNTWSSAPTIHNHDTNADYYLDLGAGNGKYVVFDLSQNQTFTHISFQPRNADTSTGTFYGYKGVQIWGSNDGTTWTSLYGPVDDTKKWYYASYNRMAFYPVGTANYRYVKFGTNGSQASTNYNRYVGIGVHDFSDGYKLAVNNASDFNIGDQITVMSDSGYSWSSREYDGYFALISGGGADPETYLHGGWTLKCTVINKDQNTLFLDRPIYWGYIEGRDSVTVVKVNKPFSVRGSINIGSTAQNDWRWPDITLNSGSNVGRKYYFGGVHFQYVGSYRYSGSTSYNRGFRNYSYDYWNAAIISGCTYEFGPDGTTWVGVGNYGGHAVFRNNLVMGMYTGFWQQSASSYTGAAYWNNKILGTIYGYYSDGSKAFDFSYNEIATCDTGMYFGTMRVNRMVVPRFAAVKRNVVKGTANTGFRLYPDQPASVSYSYIDMESNRVRATDDYSSQGWFVSSPMKDFDALAEHTGSRMSRYRNEGHFQNGDTATDLQTQMLFKNYGRYGIDIASSLYHVLARDYNVPNVVTLYDSNSDANFAKLGIEIDCLEAVAFSIEVKFDYLYEWKARLADDGTDDGRLRLLQLQRGTQVGIQYGAVPSTLTDNWATFNSTFTFPVDRGPAAIYLCRSAIGSAVHFTNSYAIIRCDEPEKLIVRINTFNHDRIWNPYRENVGDIRPLTGARTIKATRVKF